MLALIFVIFGFLIGMFSCWADQGYFDGDAIICGFIGFLIGILLIVLVFLPLCCIADTEVDYIERVELHALSDNMALEGYVANSIFLARVQVGEELRYQYLYEVEDRGYAFGSVDAKRSYLNRLANDEYSPRMDIIHYKHKSKIAQTLLVCLKDNEYIFWLPSNAEIIDTFQVDLS